MSNSVKNTTSALRLYTEIIRRWCESGNIGLHELVGKDNQTVCVNNAKELEEKLKELKLKTSLLKIFEAHFGLVKYINSASLLLGNSHYQYFLKKPDKEGRNFLNLNPADDSSLAPIAVSRMKAELALNSMILGGRRVKFSLNDLGIIAEGMLLNALILNHLFGVSDYDSFTHFYTEANKTIAKGHLQLNIPRDCYYKREIDQMDFYYNDVKEFLTAVGPVEVSLLHFVSKIVRK